MAGEVSAIHTRGEEKLRKHMYHYSKESIASVPSSYIMPKDSPLEVEPIQRLTNWRISLGNNEINFAVFVRSTNYVATKHRIVRQALYRYPEPTTIHTSQKG